jgi:hypothetical protein
MSVHSWHLSVNRAEFAKALKLVGRAGKGVRSADAILTFDNNRLAMDLSGNAAEIPAAGDWPTEVRLPGDALERLAKSLPEDDPLPLKIEGERLFAANFSIPCEWRLYSRSVSTPAREMIPANADLFDVLMTAFRCSPEEIDTAGASALVSNAQQKLDKLCEKAASFLGSHGVSPLHLKRLCGEHAAEGTRNFRESDSNTLVKIANAWLLLAPLGVEPMEIKTLMDECLRNAWRNPK